MTETCPSCGAKASGRYCSHCGAALNAVCRECSAPLPSGARFCNECGAPAAPEAPAAAPAPAARGSYLPRIVSGVALVALVAVLLLPRMRAPEAAGSEAATPATEAPFAGAPAAGGTPSAVDIANMDPREAADRLFNRVMQAVSAGDSAQAQMFLPMAIASYARVQSLDADGHYHLAVLQLVNRDFAAARAEADTILAGRPTHLFGLFAAAQAEQGLGNGNQATAFYRRFLEAYPKEMEAKLPEYQDHAQAIPSMKEEAEKAVGKGA